MGILYNLQSQTHVRKALRNDPTKGEHALWQLLKRSQLGFKIGRQYGIGNAIVDFYCAQVRVAIEIDGASHKLPGSAFHDQLRQKEIESLGIKVVRFSEADATHKTKLVAHEIERILIECS